MEMKQVAARNTGSYRRVDNVDLVELLEWLHQSIAHVVTVSQEGVAKDQRKLRNLNLLVENRCFLQIETLKQIRRFPEPQ
jgi:hypothetical protein